jgi:alkaline phosphatase
MPMGIRFAKAGLAAAAVFATGSVEPSEPPRARNVILMIADGAGYNTFRATSMHEKRTDEQVYDAEEWTRVAVATYALRSSSGIPVHPVQCGEIQFPHLGYDPEKAWDTRWADGGGDRFPYYFRGYEWLRTTAPDSANTMSAIATGRKMYRGSINTSGIGEPIEDTLASLANRSGRRVGTVTSVTLSHATPAAGAGAHALSRSEEVALAREMLSGDVVDVLIGCGHPEYDNNGEFIEKDTHRVYDHIGGADLWAALRGTFAPEDWPKWDEDHGEGALEAYRRWSLAEDREEIEKLARGNTPDKLLVLPRCGSVRLWEGEGPDAPEEGEPVRTTSQGGTLQQQRGSRVDPRYTDPGYDPRVESVPDLATLTRVALNALDDEPEGFFLFVEAGAVDWAMHELQFGRMIEEMSQFNRSVEAAVEWVEANGGWDETLLVISADHDHMLWGPNAASVPFDPIVEGPEGQIQYRWLYSSHSNALVPLFARGPGAETLLDDLDGTDPFRGPYIHQTDIYTTIRSVLAE